MGKGLPKKYAKMGFKKGWKAYKAQQRKTKSARKSSRSSSKRSTKRSNPRGGAKTSVKRYVKDKVGSIYQKARTILNLAAPTAGVQYTTPTSPWEDKLRVIIGRHTGYNYGTGEFSPQKEGTYPTYYGWGASMINDSVDKHFRFAGKRSRGKLHAWAPEVVAMLKGYQQSKVDPRGPMWGFYRAFNKATDGYDIGTTDVNSMFKLEHMEDYVKVKAGAIIYDSIVPSSWKRKANSFFPKGINPF